MSCVVQQAAAPEKQLAGARHFPVSKALEKERYEEIICFMCMLLL